MLYSLIDGDSDDPELFQQTGFVVMRSELWTGQCQPGSGHKVDRNGPVADHMDSLGAGYGTGGFRPVSGYGKF